MTTKDAVDKLRKDLKDDPGYYYAWQSNIAVQFQDACKREGIQFPQLHEISNKTAKEFLELLLKENE